jgi:hypothetical protein
LSRAYALPAPCAGLQPVPPAGGYWRGWAQARISPASPAPRRPRAGPVPRPRRETRCVAPQRAPRALPSMAWRRGGWAGSRGGEGGGDVSGVRCCSRSRHPARIEARAVLFSPGNATALLDCINSARHAVYAGVCALTYKLPAEPPRVMSARGAVARTIDAPARAPCIPVPGRRPAGSL